MGKSTRCQGLSLCVSSFILKAQFYCPVLPLSWCLYRSPPQRSSPVSHYCPCLLVFVRLSDDLCFVVATCPLRSDVSCCFLLSPRIFSCPVMCYMFLKVRFLVVLYVPLQFTCVSYCLMSVLLALVALCF